MIQVQKSTTLPAVLATLGASARLALEALYDADSSACQAVGNQLLRVRNTIYNDSTVKQQLIQDQHEKCCYCERKFLDTSPGDVEHFRPKNGFKQTKAERQLTKPGYYWLAYEWGNLFFACDRCNRSYKRSFFPLLNHPTGRARSHHNSVASEQPLLLDPAMDDAAAHISFRKEVAFGTTLRGRVTIEACGLNRLKIRENRRTHFDRIERDELLAELDLMTLAPADIRRLERKYGSLVALVRRVRQAQQVCQRAAFATAEFAGMVRANFPAMPQQ